MLVLESQSQRRLLVRLDQGEELLASLSKLAEEEGVSAAWVRGVGTLEWVELDRHDQGLRRAEPPQRFSAPCEILSLEGSLSGGDSMLHGTLSRRTDNGVEVLGGRLAAARVFSVELYLECFDDVSLTREKDRATGLWLWQGEARGGAAAPSRSAPSSAAPARPEPATQTWTQEPDEDDDDYEDEEEEERSAAPSSGGGVSWADVAAVSAAPEVARPVAREPEPAPRKRKKKKREAPVGFKPPPLPEKRKTSEAEFMDEPIPEKGDFIQHRQFGLCKVEKEDGEGGIVIKLPSGVRKTIKLDYMEVGQPRMEGTRRVFPIRPRRR
ncbi:MAG: hypothetical protein SangKO_079870 [Sandaracinaceae bacterium]